MVNLPYSRVCLDIIIYYDMTITLNYDDKQMPI
jgi:hypothetical protein